MPNKDSWVKKVHIFELVQKLQVMRDRMLKDGVEDWEKMIYLVQVILPDFVQVTQETFMRDHPEAVDPDDVEEDCIEKHLELDEGLEEDDLYDGLEEEV